MALRPRPIDVDLELEVKHPGTSMFEGSSEEEQLLLKPPPAPPSSYGTRSSTQQQLDEAMHTPHIKIPGIMEIVDGVDKRKGPVVNSKSKLILYQEPDYAEIVEYDLDSDDEEFLALLNSRSSSKNAVSDSGFELVIDSFEKACVNETVKTPLPLIAGLRADVACSVCSSRSSSGGNEILFCDSCDVAVHQACYGVLEIPDGPWLCRACESMARDKLCIMCGQKGGALKRSQEDQWCHVVCALWIPELSFMSADLMEPVRGIPSIPAYKKNCMCTVCKKAIGVGVQCSSEGCDEKFHVSCAQKACLELTFESDEFGALCRRHSLERWVSERLEDESIDDHKLLNKKLITKLTRGGRRKAAVPNERLLQIIYRYWVRKRIQLGNARNDSGPGAGPALLRRIDVKRNRPANRAAFVRNDMPPVQVDYAERKEEFRQLRRELERARVLLDRCKKREKDKKELIQSSRKLFELRVKSLREGYDVDESMLPDELTPEYVELISEDEDDEFRLRSEKPILKALDKYEPQWESDEERQRLMREAAMPQVKSVQLNEHGEVVRKRKRGRPKGSFKKKHISSI